MQTATSERNKHKALRGTGYLTTGETRLSLKVLKMISAEQLSFQNSIFCEAEFSNRIIHSACCETWWWQDHAAGRFFFSSDKEAGNHGRMRHTFLIFICKEFKQTSAIILPLYTYELLCVTWNSNSLYWVYSPNIKRPVQLTVWKTSKLPLIKYSVVTVLFAILETDTRIKKKTSWETMSFCTNAAPYRHKPNFPLKSDQTVFIIIVTLTGCLFF